MLKIFRLTFVVIWLFIAMFIASIICILRPFHHNNGYFFSRVFSLLSYKILGIDVIIEGKEFLHLDESAILICNHQSNYDLFLVTYLIPKRAVTIGKHTLAWIPFFGQIYWLTGQILVNRTSRAKSLVSMKAASKKIKDKNLKIWMMPEGTRSLGRGLLPFKKGAFYLAAQNEIPIITIAVGDFRNYDLNKWRPGKLHVKIGAPVYASGKSKEDISSFCHSTYEDMKKTLATLN